jgi:hypothetical protein
MLRHIVYISTATGPLDADAAQALLEDARDFNAQHEVTGLLVHAAGSFLQVMEGREDDVEAAYARAAASRRHRALLRTPAFAVQERAFPNWAMGFERAAPSAVVSTLLQPLVDHKLVTAEQVRDVLLERFTTMRATPVSS